MIKRVYLLLIAFFLIHNPAWAQDLMDDLNNTNPLEQESDISAYPTETILRIAPSKKIMLLTNENNSFNEGDFLSLIYEKKMMVRVLCARMSERTCGIKLIRIYDDQLWVKAFDGMQVQVLRGDDSQFKGEQDKTNVDKKEELESLEDLYAKDDLDSNDNVELSDNKNRALRNDNIIGISYGVVDGVDNAGDSTKYAHWHVHWAYQVADNFFGEALVGYSLIGDFPPTGSTSTLSTQLTSVTVRLKYTFKAPFYSFILPYVGYQQVFATSPDAGNAAAVNPALELSYLDMMKQSRLVFGATVLKRIVPGWFITGNIGTDFFSAGLSLEF